MTKKEYLNQLSAALRPMKRAERSRSVAYFSEVIDDRMEDGSTEDQVVSSMEPVQEAASRILAEAADNGTMKKQLGVWAIVLIVLGFPVWFPLLATVAVLIITLYATIWILIAAVFIISVSFALCGIIGALAMLGMAVAVPFPAVMSFGAGLMLSGIGVALFMPAVYLARGYAAASAAMWRSALAHI